MSWIESHQNLKDNPKVMDLATAMKWDKLFSATQEVLARDLAIAKLHLFWWWCMDYALSGDLQKHVKKPSRLAIAVNLPGNQGQRFLRAMIDSGWIDEKPYLRVHDWWDYSRRYIKLRFKDKPERWQEIERLYAPPASASSQTTPRALHQASEKNGASVSVGSVVGKVVDDLKGAASPSHPVGRLRKFLSERFAASDVDYLISWSASQKWSGDTESRVARTMALVLYTDDKDISDKVKYVVNSGEPPTKQWMSKARLLLRDSSVTAP